MTPQKRRLMQPHIPVMDARRMPGRFGLLGAADSTPDQWSTTRIFLTSNLRSVFPSIWKIQETEYKGTRDINAHLLTRMRTSRLAQQHEVPPGQKPLPKPWQLSKKHYKPR